MEFKKGDIVVRINDTYGGMLIGNISEILRFDKSDLPIIKNFEQGGSHIISNLRLATQEEAEYYIKQYGRPEGFDSPPVF